MSSEGHFNSELLYLSENPGDNMASLIFHHLRFFSFLFVFALVYTLRIGMAPCGQLLHVGILAALRSNLSSKCARIRLHICKCVYFD